LLKKGLLKLAFCEFVHDKTSKSDFDYIVYILTTKKVGAFNVQEVHFVCFSLLLWVIETKITLFQQKKLNLRKFSNYAVS